MANSHVMCKICVSGSERYLLATLIYFVCLRSVEDWGSFESNDDSGCDLKSTGSDELIFVI